MIEVKTLSDVLALKNNPAVDSRYSAYIEEYFLYLMETFREDKPEEEFSLVPHGHIVLLTLPMT